MPLIIDANRSNDFKEPVSECATAIIIVIKKKRAKVAVGGKLLKELFATQMRDLIAEWERSGCICRQEDAEIDVAETFYKSKSLKSNDPHILALAHVSNSKLLFTGDKNLMADFKDPRLCHGKIISPTTSLANTTALLKKYAG